ncbi:hypothetical protein HYU07_03435 [Candidatus Woesearchaeota archaeon]|nr:hypothetical protein [Candidatus Woesearchaeota archaeon]
MPKKFDESGFNALLEKYKDELDTYAIFLVLNERDIAVVKKDMIRLGSQRFLRMQKKEKL